MILIIRIAFLMVLVLFHPVKANCETEELGLRDLNDNQR